MRCASWSFDVGPGIIWGVVAIGDGANRTNAPGWRRPGRRVRAFGGRRDGQGLSTEVGDSAIGAGRLGRNGLPNPESRDDNRQSATHVAKALPFRLGAC